MRLISRAAVSLLLIFLPFIGITAAQPEPLETPDTTTFRGSLARTGAYDSPALRETPSLRWSFDIPRPVRMTPAVAEGRVYIGGEEGVLYALDAVTGAEEWRVTIGGSLVSTPTVENGRLYVGGLDSIVYALDSATGEELWRYTTGGQVYASPALVEGTLFIGTRDRSLYALDALTGELRWQAETGGEIWSSATYTEGWLFVGSTDGAVYAFDAETGDPLWSTAVGGEIRATPAVEQGVLFIGTADGSVAALDVVEGDILAQYALSEAPIEASAAVLNRDLYAIALDGTLTALTFNDESREWTVRWSENIGGPAYSSPTYADGALYVITEAGGLLHAFDTESGDTLWTYQTGTQGDWRSACPVLIDGVLFVSSNTEGILALESP